MPVRVQAGKNKEFMTFPHVVSPCVILWIREWINTEPIGKKYF